MVTVIKCSVLLPQRCSAWPVSVISLSLHLCLSLSLAFCIYIYAFARCFCQGLHCIRGIVFLAPWDSNPQLGAVTARPCSWGKLWFYVSAFLPANYRFFLTHLFHPPSLSSWLSSSHSRFLFLSLTLWCEITVNSTIWLLWTVIDHAAGPDSLLYLSDTQCVVLGGMRHCLPFHFQRPHGTVAESRCVYSPCWNHTHNKTEIL